MRLTSSARMRPKMTPMKNTTGGHIVPKHAIDDLDQMRELIDRDQVLSHASKALAVVAALMSLAAVAVIAGDRALVALEVVHLAIVGFLGLVLSSVLSTVDPWWSSR